MPDTRTTRNLKNTSIRDYLLDNKTDTTINHIPEKNMSDTKQSPSTMTNTLHHIQDIETKTENRQLFMKPSNEVLSSMLSINNDQQKLSPTPRPISQYSTIPIPGETCQQMPDNVINSSVTYGQQATVEILLFSGNKNEDPGQWLDHIFAIIEQKELTPGEQRDLAAARLAGEALLWYRLNRLKMPDMQSFIHQFLLTYNPPQTKTSTSSVTPKDMLDTDALQEQTMVEKEVEQMYGGTSKSSIMEQDQYSEPASQTTLSRQVLQSARNEKVKLFPNFSGAENSLYWLKNLQQIGKSLKLNDQQIYELATIKLSGPAQEWFYHQDDEIDNWSSFKQVFLRAFPPPIQPTNIDYLAQLLARKQGETEPVGKFVQDVNRLCLKLDDKITEQDKLQYLRRGLRPQLQHYALSITSLQDFLTIMQRHEQIEKETTASQYSSFTSSSRSIQQQTWFNRPKQNDQEYQQNQVSTKYKASDRYQQQNSNPETNTQRFEKDYRICYQCNKRGHLQWNCPDNKFSQHQNQQHPQQYHQQNQQQHPQQYQQDQQQHPHQYQQQHFQQGGY
jgi:hypothetical protein